MAAPRILSKSVSSLLILGLSASSLGAATIVWDGGPLSTGTDLGTGANWVGDVLPTTAGDTAQWNGTAPGNLSLVYSDTSYAGAIGDAGLNLDLTAAQTGALAIDSGTNTNSFRINNINIATGAGAFSLGEGTNAFNMTLGGTSGQTHAWTNDSANTATVASDVVTGLGGGGTHTLALAGAGNWVLNNVVSNGTGTLAVTKSGAGSLTLTGTSTYTGGLTLNAGTLNFNNAGAAGNTTGGALTIAGGTLNNTSGAAITTTTAKAVNVNGDFTFTGANNLSFNLGTMTLGGATGTRTINVANGVLSVGLLNAGAGIGLTKTGAGILAMGASSLANTSNVAGTLDVQAGKVQINSDFTVGGLTGSGTVENGGLAGKWFFVNNAVDNTFSGTISDGPNPATVRIGLVKSGTGTLNLTGANNTFSDNFEVRGGTVRMTGVNSTGYATGGQATVGNTANTNGTLIIDGGTLNATKATSPSLAIGSGSNSRGFLQMASGTINATSQINIGNGSATGANGFSAVSMSGGTMNSGSWFVVGANFDRSILNQSGGTINVTANRMTIGAGGNGSIGVVNVSGNATLNSIGGIFVGENGVGTINLSGNGLVNSGTNTTVFGNNASSIAGNINLNGGTLAVGSLVKGASTATAVYLLNFNGGTLKANTASTTFLASLANTTAYVNSGGATIDTNGFDDTVAQPLLAPTGSGVASIAAGTGGAGYIDTPLVTLTGGTGTGAQAVAIVSGGAVTGYTITNPGVGYTAGDVLTATLFGGGATTAATPGTIAVAPIATTGGLTKIGTGALTIGSTTSTYGGPTTISNGVLAVSAVGNGGAASSLGASSNAASNLVLDGGTLRFTGATGSTDRAFTLPAGKTGTIDVPTAGNVLTITGASTGAGILTKTGAGVLALTAPTTHTAATNANGGVLGLTGTMAGPLVVGAGRVNAVYQAVGALTAPTLTLGAGSGLDFDFGAGNDVITIANANGLTLGTTSLNLYQAGGSTAFTTNGTYTLLDYTTAYNGALLGSFSVANSQPGKIYSIADNTANTTIELTIGDAFSSNWNVDGSGSWTTATNWSAGVPNSIGATANFGTILTAPASIAVNGPKTVGNLVFNGTNSYNITGAAADVITLNNGLGTAMITASSGTHTVSAPIALVNPSILNADAGASLTIAGPITGAVALTKSGAGNVFLTGTNGTTTTTIIGGTLYVGNGGTSGSLGSGAVTIGTGAALDLNRSDAFTVANAVSGLGNLVQDGSGTATYTGTATHTGITDINAGTFVSNGTINGTTALTVDNATATLGGSSTTSVAGPINIATAGGTGTLNLSSTGTTTTTGEFNIGNTAGSNGTLNVTLGTLTQTGSGLFYVGRNGGTGNYTQGGGTVNAGDGGIRFGVDGTGSLGKATITGGSLATTSELWISNLPGNTGTVTMSGGQLSSNSWFVVGRDRATGTLNLNGGTITKGNVGGSFLIIGSLGGTGTLTQTAGAINVTTGGIRIGENTGTTPALNGLWDMQGGTATVTGEINVGWRSSQATWNIGGSSTVTATGRLIVAAETNNTGANSGVIVNGAPIGTVNMSGGTATFSGSDSRIGGDNSSVSSGAIGTVNVSGGTLNFGGNVQVGAYGQGTMTISGTGVVNSTAGFPSIGRFVGGVGTLNVNGGTFTQSGTTNILVVGEEGTGTLNLNSGRVDVQELRLGHVATGNGTLNLNGGVLSTKVVQQTVAGSASRVKFNGGTLQAKADTTDFLLSVPSASITVENNGAVIDTNGHLVTISQGLAPSAGSTGGLSKQGTGTLTLSGASTYTGATVVQAGTLAITGSISGSTLIDVKAGSTLDVSTSGMTFTSGQTLGGTGSILGNLTLGAGAKLAPGESPGTLSLSGSLDLSPSVSPVGSGALVFELAVPAGSDKVAFSTGALTIGTGVLAFDDFAFSRLAGFTPGTYTLFDGTSPIVGSLDAANLAGSLGGGFTGTLALADSGRDIVLNVVPEPGSAALLLGLTPLLVLRRFRRRLA